MDFDQRKNILVSKVKDQIWGGLFEKREAGKWSQIAQFDPFFRPRQKIPTLDQVETNPVIKAIQDSPVRQSTFEGAHK